MSGKRRGNTFRIDFAKVPKKPSYEELHKFLGETLGLQREQVVRLQCSKIHGCAFVKTCDLETAQRIVEEHDGKHSMEVDKKVYTLRMWMEDGGVDVKLYDLSEDVTDNAIIEFMAAYGDIISIREVLWDDKYSFGAIPNGIRVVRMVVKKNIPSVVTIDGEATSVHFQGQLATCRHCGELAHSGIPCVQNKKLLVQKLDADRKKPSYANVAKIPTTPVDPSVAQTQHHRTTSVTRVVTTPSSSENTHTHQVENNVNTTKDGEHSNQRPSFDFKKPKSTQQTSSASKFTEQMIIDDESRNNENGNDTDGSTTSNGSRSRNRGRPPSKKIRQDAGVVSHTESSTKQ